MKKIFFIILLLFCINVDAKEVSNVEIEWIPNAYYNYKVGGITYWGQMGYYYVDGKIAYCLELDKRITTNTYYEVEEEENSLVVLTGYFGYGYNGDINYKDYLATQKLIWGYLGYKDFYFTTSSNSNGDIIDLQEYEYKIIGRINRYALFSNLGEDLIFNYKSVNDIVDTNQILSNFEIINNSNNNIYAQDNNLYFEANEVGSNYFELKTKYISRNLNAIYVANESQKLMVIGEVENLYRPYYYKVSAPSLNICIKPTKHISLNLDTQNTIKLYKNNIEIGTYLVNNDDCVNIYPLENGDYNLKLVSISEGYYDKNDVHSIPLINNENLDYDIYIDPINSNVEIIKTYGYKNENYINYDSDVTYKIYDSNDKLVDEITTNEYGTCNTYLDYGDYRIVQVNTNNIDNIHEDLYIYKNDFKDKYLFEIYDEIDKYKFRLIPIDIDTNEILDSFSFSYNGIDYNVGNEYVSDRVEYGDYEIFNLGSNGYKSIEIFNFIINDNSSFYVLNEELVTDIFIPFNKIDKYKFRLVPIDINTNEILTNFSFTYNGISYNAGEEYISDEVEYGDYEITNLSSTGYDSIVSYSFSINDDSDFYIYGDAYITDKLILFNLTFFEEEVLDEETIDNTIIENITEENEGQIEKAENIIEEEEKVIEDTNDVLVNDINKIEESEEKIKVDNQIKKLPNLGVYFENKVFSNYIFMFNNKWLCK